MNISEHPQSFMLDKEFEIPASELILFEKNSDGWSIRRSINPSNYPLELELPETVRYTNWSFRTDDAPWEQLDKPKASYLLKKEWPIQSRVVEMELTAPALLTADSGWKCLRYKAEFAIDRETELVLILEPTAIRGNLKIEFAEQCFSQVVKDIQPCAHQIKLGMVQKGQHEILFHFSHPEPFDGIPWPPTILVK